ncbi:MAG: monovalent cation/H(+) antiporter subunit G [Pseudomonadota bacterium]
MSTEDVLMVIAGLLCIFGAGFVLVAAIGVLRLDDLYMRMHAASKAGTLGSGVLLVALAVNAETGDIVMRALAGVVFFLLTAPVSAHLLARAAYLVGYKPCDLTKHDALSDQVDTAP